MQANCNFFLRVHNVHAIILIMKKVRFFKIAEIAFFYSEME